MKWENLQWRNNKPSLYIVLLAIFIGSLIIDCAMQSVWRLNFFVNEPLHTAIEAFGSIIALGVALILFSKNQHYQIHKKNLLATGFLGMGILNGFHAVSSLGQGFFLLHSLANIVGGSCFVLSLLPHFDRFTNNKKWIPWVVAACCVLVGIWIIGFQDLVPLMMHDDQITTTAVALNVIAGTLLIVAMGFFALDFYRHGRFESYLFACTFLLFGLGELELPFSSLWYVNWWFWHFQQLAAYFIVVYFLFQIYQRAEMALKGSEDTFRTITGTLKDAIIMMDEDERVSFWNPAAEKMFGYSRHEAIGVGLQTLIVPHNYTEAYKRGITAFKADRVGPLIGKAFEIETRRKDGSEFPVELSFSAVRIKGRWHAAGIIRDITERKLAEEELRNSHSKLELLVEERTAQLSMVNEQLRNLSVYLQNARENERTMIAREIHDELGQSLTALKIDLSLLVKRLPANQKPVMEKAESMAELIETTIQSVKRISTDLRPGVLDHLGLTAAIEWQAEEFEKRTGIHCAVFFEPEEITLDKDRTTTVFRIFQETLTNVARHAKALDVSVVLKKLPDSLMLQVKDNGKGISEKHLSDPKSLGLIGIRERVYYWGGSLTISGPQNEGTTVTVQLPLDGRRSAF